MIRLVIAEDNKLQRDGILLYLARENGIEIAGLAPDGLQAINLVREHCPDVVILDIRMPVLDGLSALPQIRECDPRMGVLMWPGEVNRGALERAFRDGALGFVSKMDTYTEIVAAIGAVHAGQRYASASVLSSFPDALRMSCGAERDASATR